MFCIKDQPAPLQPALGRAAARATAAAAGNGTATRPAGTAPGSCPDGTAPWPSPAGAAPRPGGTDRVHRRDRSQGPPKHRCPVPRPDRPVKDTRRVGLDSTVMSQSSPELESAVRAALAKVIDPELRRPITELGMVKNVTIEPDGGVHVEVYLTTAACPKKTEISERVSQAVADVPGTGAVKVTLDVMSDEQRTELRKQLRGDSREPVIPFAQPGSLTRVYAVASGKGGVGKSSVTVNLAAAMAARGLSVGVLDADIYGHSVPRMMGTTDRPTQVESMILPPVAHDVRVISIAMFTQGNTPVVWRGPMLHRALQQFLADVYWGDLDVLLLDLPPGTGDVAISVAQLIPGAEILVVTTPQLAAAEVAERAGAIALQTRQRIVGVVENMSGLLLPDGTTMQIFGEGGGQQVAESLSRARRRRRAAARPGSARTPRWWRRATPGYRWCCRHRIRSRARSYAASPTRCRAASAGWRACRWAWTRPVAKSRRVSNGVVAGGLRASSGSTGARCRRGVGARWGSAGFSVGLSTLPVKIESSPSSRCLVSAARGVMPRSLFSSTQRLAKVVELGAEVVAQLAGCAADVVAGLPQRARRPPDRSRQAFGPQDHQPGDHQDQHLAPADVGEHRLACCCRGRG